jgi:hypothetical protein
MRQGERIMRGRQGGVSLVGLIIGLFIFIIVALFGMKVVPSYMEFRTAKSVIQALAREKQAATPGEIRQAFYNRALIDGVEAIQTTDLEITKQGTEVTIAFAYRKEIPLFTGVALCIDYAAKAGSQ